MLQGKGILTPIQRHCLEAFGQLPDQERFYLTGGTALAEFVLGHRLSFDLDFFSGEQPLILPFSHSLEQAYRRAGWEVSVVRRFATFVEFLLARGGGKSWYVDLASRFPFQARNPCLVSEYGVAVNGYKDLVADKVLAYYGRAEPRDAVDFWFLLQQIRLDELLSLAGQKDAGFDLYWFAQALNKAEAFPDDLTQWPVKMLIALDPVALKQSFHAIAMEAMSRLLPPGGNEKPPQG